MPALEGFEYRHQVGPRWNNAHMKELQHVLAMRAPPCQKLIFEGFGGMVGYEDGSPEMVCLRRILRAWIRRDCVSQEEGPETTEQLTPVKEVECWIDHLVWSVYTNWETSIYRNWGNFEDFCMCIKTAGFDKIMMKVVSMDGGLENVEWRGVRDYHPQLSPPQDF